MGQHLRRELPGRVTTRESLSRYGTTRLSAQETFPAIHGATLSRLERHGGLTTALRARGHRLGLGKSAATTGRTLALRLAGLAALGLVLEVLIVEEVLFSRCKYKICSAIDALEDAVLEFRHTDPLST